MANIVPSTTPAVVEVTYSQSGLFVGVTIWDCSSGSPVQVTGLSGMVNDVLPLTNWSLAGYFFKHLGVAGKWYLYKIAAYTDGAYLTQDQNQPEGSDSLYFEAPPSASNSSAAAVVGIVMEDDPVFGVV